MKNPENLTDKQAATHRKLRRAGGEVWRAYTLKEVLRGIFAPGLSLDDVVALLERFISRAARSRLQPFIRLGQTIAKHRDGILAAIQLAITNARTEALNNKGQVDHRRAYGFHSADAALALVLSYRILYALRPSSLPEDRLSASSEDPSPVVPSDAAAAQLRYYARTAEAYEADHVDPLDEHGVALAHVVSYLTRLGCESILDTGCGTGRAMRSISTALPHVEVRGNDPSPDLLRIARDRFGISADALDEASSAKLPYGDNSVDAVVATSIMHHVARPELIVSEMLRVARQAVFISDCNIYGMGGAGARLLKWGLSRAKLLRSVNRLRRGGHEWFYSPGDGVAWSYSVFDSYQAIAAVCREVAVIPTAQNRVQAGPAPLFLSSHCLLCGFKEPWAQA